MLLSVEETRKATVTELEKLLSANNVLGDPVEVEDKVIIPVTGFGFGFGSGGGKGEGMGGGKGESPKGEAKGDLTGGGAGGALSPAALVVAYKGVKGPDGIQVLPLKKPSPIVDAISKSMPDVVEALKAKAAEKGK